MCFHESFGIYFSNTFNRNIDFPSVLQIISVLPEFSETMKTESVLIQWEGKIISMVPTCVPPFLGKVSAEQDLGSKKVDDLNRHY